MTSKEELYKIANHIVDCSIERTGAHPTAQIKEDEMYWVLRTNPFQQILKDLEVLEAFKRNVGIRIAIQEWANKETEVMPDDRKKVKEWLDNGNH